MYETYGESERGLTSSGNHGSKREKVAVACFNFDMDVGEKMEGYMHTQNLGTSSMQESDYKQ